jgi:hypothetical protein
MSGYAKLFGSILHSTVWLEPNHVRLVWITMLAMANRRGLVEASLPGLAVAARVSLEECQEALNKFTSPDPHSRTKDHEGRRIEEVDGGWVLLNYEKHRQAQARTLKSERQARWRAKKASTERLSVDDSQCNTVSETSTSGSGSMDYGSEYRSDLPDRSEPRAGEQVPRREPVSPIESRARMYLEDPMAARLQLQPPEGDPSVLALCKAWSVVWGAEVRLRGGLNDPRLRAILGRLAEGFTVEQLTEAIRGSKNDEFIAERKSLQTLATVLKDAGAVDKYASLVAKSAEMDTGLSQQREANRRKREEEDAAARQRRHLELSSLVTEEDRERLKNAVKGSFR